MFYPEYIDPKKLINNDDLLLLFKLVEKNGGSLRFVGGAVRDALVGISRTDVDLVTDMSPSEFSDMCDDEGLRCIPIGIQFFTLGVMIHNSFFKVTCLSVDEDSTQDEWKKDAAKRDLTINAVYADDKGNVFDYYNGIQDLEKGVIKFIGKPAASIDFDCIRVMRFFRFCAMFGKKIDKKSLKCCIEKKDLLQKVSLEKIKDELFKIIMAPYAIRALELLFNHGILDFLIAPPKDYNKIEKYIEKESILNLDHNVIVRIFLLFEPTLRRAERLSSIFRLNKEQKEHLLTLCQMQSHCKEFKNSASINKLIYKYGKIICKEMFIFQHLDDVDSTELSQILNTVDSINLPKFPLTGKDLLLIGADKKFIGLYLDVLKKEWIESDCSLTKNNLLDKYEKIFKYSV